MLMIISIAFTLYVLYRFYQHFFPFPNIDPKGKYVLITGCGSGFGYELAVALDKQGFNVFAGIRNVRSESLLKSRLSSRSTVFVLDITKPEDIDAAYNMVKEKTNTLHALVNNAGIAIGGHIDWISMEFIRMMMDVNFFGHVAMTKKFLPLLIAKRGSRVVNVSSASGFLPVTSMSAYSAAKFAFESFFDCLRREMVPWDLRVSIIEPGFVKTPMVDRYDNELYGTWKKVLVDVRERWGDDYFKDQSELGIIKTFSTYSENLDKSLVALQHAVMNTVPRILYRPGWQSSLVFFPCSIIPTWLCDLIQIKWGIKGVPPAGLYKQQKE